MRLKHVARARFDCRAANASVDADYSAAAVQQATVAVGEDAMSGRASKRSVQKTREGAAYFLGELLTLGTRTTEAQGWKRRSLTTNWGY